MKLKTFIKLGAVGVAAATAAAGSLVLTTKAVKKLENEERKSGNVDLQNPAVDKILAGGQKLSDLAKNKASQNESESTFKADFKYASAPKPNVVQGHMVHDVSSYADATPVQFAEPAAPVSAPIPQPIPAPIPEPIPAPIPTPIPAPIPEPIPEPIPVSIPTPEVPSPVAVETPVEAPADAPVEPVVAEQAKEPDDNAYTYIPMELPYLAGKLGKDNEECAEVIITPAEHKAQEDAEAAEAAAEPVVEPVVEPVAEPEITLPTAEPIDEHPATEPILGTVAEEPTTFADINPLEQGFVVGMADIDGESLPMASETSTPETFADIAPIESTPAPVTFGDLNAEYTSELPTAESVAAEDVVAEPQEVVAPVEDEVAAVPVIETPVEPVAEVAEPIAPIAEAEPVKAVEEVKGREIQIGASVVSDRSDNAAILAVANTFGLSAQNLVSITAEQTMVFEFLYSDMRNDATLINVFFVLPNGQATMPPEAEREGVIAFARNFITANEELKNFLLG